MNSAILVLNAGSSSIKFAIYDAAAGNDAASRYGGEIDGIGHEAHLRAHDANGTRLADITIAGDGSHHAALSALLKWIASHSGEIELVCAGHRVVHGGRAFSGPVKITADVLQKLDALSPLAPQHQPHNLAAIRALARLHPALLQVACFDTSFHVTQPAVATAFALPRALSDKGVKRYGFHGLSYDYIASVLPKHLGETADGKVVVAHLGHGASMCAMLRRQSVATTMGFSALDGLVMGTRCGALDPGVILYLLDELNMGSKAIGHLLYNESGLLGVSGVSDDMRDLQASSDPRAAEAIELFCLSHRARARLARGRARRPRCRGLYRRHRRAFAGNPLAGLHAGGVARSATRREGESRGRSAHQQSEQ